MSARGAAPTTGTVIRRYSRSWLRPDLNEQHILTRTGWAPSGTAVPSRGPLGVRAGRAGGPGRLVAAARTAQHRMQRRLAEWLAQGPVGPNRFHDFRRASLLLPERVDQSFGLSPQGFGLAVRLVSHLQGRRVPQADCEVAGAGHQRRAIGAKGQRPDVVRVPLQPSHLLAPRQVPEPDRAIAAGRRQAACRPGGTPPRRLRRCAPPAPGTRQYRSARLGRCGPEPHEARRRLSGLNVTVRITSSCPGNWADSSYVWASNRQTVFSSAPAPASQRPSAL